MKYVSVLFLGLAMSWSWGIVHREGAVSFETHSGIQERVAQILVQEIAAKHPEIRNLQVDRMWSESVDKDRVRAHFVYSYTEGEQNERREIRGYWVLQRQVDDGSGLDRWRRVSAATNQESLQFDEPLLITPGPDEAEPPATTPGANDAPTNSPNQ